MANATSSPQPPWYSGISRYQWLVLLIASLGWVFDVFEGQIFVTSERQSLPQMLGVSADHPEALKWTNASYAMFLLGGAVGGIVFGVMGDRIGRSKTMIFTILFYSLFTCLTAFSQSPWQMVVLRFFVAMGVGGEWAVASAMVAEVMPLRSRPIMSSIFHASSVLGTLLAIAAGTYIVGNPDLGWRWGFAIGVVPALLTLWVRWSLREPDSWVKAKEAEKANPTTAKRGDLRELFKGPHLRNTLVGVALSSIGLVTFWGAHIYGKNALMRLEESKILTAEGISLTAPADADAKPAWLDSKKAALKAHEKQQKDAEMLSMFLNTVGGGLGLVLFGTISNRLGRKGAFVLYHAVAFVMVIVLFKGLAGPGVSPWALIVALPIFGFFTLGMHAGYAVYFPELYPTRLRGSGAGFCFNMGRVATAIAFFGFIGTTLSNEAKALALAPLYLVGIVVVLLARETRGEELPE